MKDMQRPEGALLSQLRNEHPLRPSMRKAAGWVPLSEARWRQIENGYATNGGRRAPVEAPAETLAAMVSVLGGTADDLRRVGRDDAALAIDTPRIQSMPDARPPITLDELRRIDDHMLVRELERRLAERLGGGFHEQAQAAPMNPAGGSPAPVTDAPRDGGPRGADAEAGRLREAELDDAARPRAQDYAGEDWARLGDLRRRNEERKRALFGDEVAPPSRGDLSPEARPDLYVDEAAQHREGTSRESDAPDEAQP